MKMNKTNNMKPHTRIPRAALAALCIFSLSPALLCAADTAQPAVVHGTIKSVDTAAHTLVVTERKNNAEQTFQWSDQTLFTERGQSATADALKPSEHVELTYAPGGGTPILQSVHIAPPRTGRHGANNSPTARSNGA